MQYASMSDSERDEELFRDESPGQSDEERLARKSRRSKRSSSNPSSSEDEEARKARRKGQRKSSKRPMTEEEIRARNSRRSAKMEAEAAGLAGGPDGRRSSREEDPRSSRRSTRPSGSSVSRQGSTPGARSMSGSRGIDEAVKLGDDYDAEDPRRSRPRGSQGRPAPRPSSASKKKQEINKDFKDVRETGRWGSISKREMWIVGIVGLLVIIGVIVAVVVVTTTGGDEPAPAAPIGTPPPAPTLAPTARVVLTPQEQLDAIRGATIDNPNTQDSLQLLPEDVSFYQGKADDPTAAPVVRAASWIMYDDPIDNEEWLIVRYALAVIYYSTVGDAWTTTEGWMTDAGTCDWHGIRCDRFNTHVEEIDLSGNNLVGSIPNETNMVTGLISLWMRRNSLTGNVPNAALGSIPKLSILYLDENNLSGTIGVELSASGSLKTLFLQANELTGFLPREFCPRGGVGGLLEFGIDCDKMECFCCGPDNCF